MEIRVMNDIEIKSGLSLLSYGHENCSPDKYCVKMKRPRYVLHVVMCGKGCLSFGDNKKVILSAGDAFLLYKNETYSYEPDRQMPWTYSWLTIDGDNLEELFLKCGFTKDKPYVHLDDFRTIVSIMSQLVNSYGENMEYYFERSSYMLLILSKMIQQNKKRMDVREEKIEKRRSFRTVVSYMRDNYMNDLNVSRISSAVFLSESYVKHLFIEMSGMSLTEFLNRWRISKACVLFRQSPEMSDMQVAKRVGYDNYTYFLRLFKRYCAMSPREYKKAEFKDDPFAWVKENMLYVFNEEEIDWLE